MEEAPNSRTDVIREANPHLRIADIASAELNIDEGHVMGECPRITAKFLPLTPLLHTVQVVMGEFPGLLQTPLLPGGAGGKSLRHIAAKPAELPPLPGAAKPGIQCCLIEFLHSGHIACRFHTEGIEQLWHEILIPIGNGHHCPINGFTVILQNHPMPLLQIAFGFG